MTTKLDARGAGWKRARKKQACGEIRKLGGIQRPKLIKTIISEGNFSEAGGGGGGGGGGGVIPLRKIHTVVFDSSSQNPYKLILSFFDISTLTTFPSW